MDDSLIGASDLTQTFNTARSMVEALLRDPQRLEAVRRRFLSE